MNLIRSFVLAVLACCGQSMAQFDFMGGGMPSTLSVSTTASVQSYQAGKPFYVALKGEISAPWHAYWQNPGTVGEPMTATISAPEGFSIKGPFWQVPHKHEGVLGVAYTYENPVIVWEITPAGNAPATATFTISATAQTCSDEGCNAPETKDNDFTWKDFQSRNNSELVAVLGNFVNRALVLTKKYYDGVIPERGELTDYDEATIEELQKIKASLERNIEHYHFREALKDAMAYSRIGNKYLADTEPWKVVKTNPERVKTILNIALQITANTAIAIEPFMPFTAEKMLKMLAVDKFGWEQLGSMELMAAGHTIGEAQLLFEKIEDDVIQKQLDKLEASRQARLQAEAAQNIEAQKEEVSFDDFQKMDIRVSTILAAEKVAKTKKLLKLTIDTGIDKRTIVSGIAEYYTPEQLVGRQVLVLANLAPREIKGIESRGMILMAEDALGRLVLVQPEDKTMSGAMIG